MSSKQQPILTYCRQIREISLKFGEPFRSEKKRLLNAVPDFNKCSAADILQLHDSYSTMIAWPENRSLLDLAKRSMGSLVSVTTERIRLEPQLEYKLIGTGIAGTEITGHFSYEMTRWLVKEFGKSVKLESWDAKPETIKLFFRQLFPRVEYETIFSGNTTPQRRIKMLKGNSTQTDLVWLMLQFEQSSLPDSVKDFLFNELKIFITWKLEKPEHSRSGMNISRGKLFFHNKLRKTADIRNIISRRLPLPARLTPREKIQLVNAAKASLVFLYRETDPFTFASAGELVCFDLERGYSIALYSLKKEHRLSIESYIGYLALKNGIPVAYGGGWIFGERCQFGINILEPFRGYESSYVLGQLIRVYYQYYGAKRLVVKPYQFGLKNKEGLESGAFWFYYKYGFRPETTFLKKLAGEERVKIIENKNYRTPVSTLKKFTGANLELILDKNPVPAYDAAMISKAITNYIIKAFNGDRKKAITASVQKTRKILGIRDHSGWTSREKKVLQEWSLLAMANLDLSSWYEREIKQFMRLIKSKANSSEWDFIRLLQKHRRFWQDLDRKFG